MNKPIIIIGAGLAGLACAMRLEMSLADYIIFEKSDRVGGRVATDDDREFLYDRGFQVLLDNYSEVELLGIYGQLGLRRFLPGAKIRRGRRVSRIQDPLRSPLRFFQTAFAGCCTIRDKVLLLMLRRQVIASNLAGDSIWAGPEQSTESFLEEFGFSKKCIDSFFRPFYGGIFLDRSLATSSRMFLWTFGLFSSGSACLPANGMAGLPQAMAAAIPINRLRLNSPVARIEGLHIALENGTEIEGSSVVLAVDEPAAISLQGGTNSSLADRGVGVSCYYFAASHSPEPDPILVLNGGTGIINNLCVPSIVSPGYSRSQRHLVSITVLGDGESRGGVAAVLEECREWYGREVDRWEFLRDYNIPYALPCQVPPLPWPRCPPSSGDRVATIGDYKVNASIQGALQSGRQMAARLLTG